MKNKSFSHFDKSGNPAMVDINPKLETRRIAIASGTVFMHQDGSDWDGRDHLGQIVSPGTYLIHIEAMNFQTGVTSSGMVPVVVAFSP